MVLVGNPFVEVDFASLMAFLIVALELYHPLKMSFCCLFLSLGQLDMKMYVREAPDIGDNNFGVCDIKHNLCSS